jgi:hypothetical protein
VRQRGGMRVIGGAFEFATSGKAFQKAVFKEWVNGICRRLKRYRHGYGNELNDEFVLVRGYLS